MTPRSGEAPCERGATKSGEAAAFGDGQMLGITSCRQFLMMDGMGKGLFQLYPDVILGDFGDFDVV